MVVEEAVDGVVWSVGRVVVVEEAAEGVVWSVVVALLSQLMPW